MKIGIISDTHFTEEDFSVSRNLKLKKHLQLLFDDCDHLIHAGDVACGKFISILQEIAPTSVVQGNMDYLELSNLPQKIVLSFEGVKIGITHKPENIGWFSENEIKVFIHGHTHIPLIQQSEEGYLVINPGSYSRPRIRKSSRLFDQESTPQPSIAYLEIMASNQEPIISAIIKRFAPY